MCEELKIKMCRYNEGWIEDENLVEFDEVRRTGSCCSGIYVCV